jgi:hypothetical protein
MIKWEDCNEWSSQQTLKSERSAGKNHGLSQIASTHSIREIQPWFTYSKWNMGEIYGFNLHLSYVHTTQDFFLNCSMVIGHFYYWICNFVENSSFLWSKMNYKKMVCTWRNFKIIFSRPLFTIIFRSKTLILCTYSISST